MNELLITRVTGGTSPVREGDWAGFKFGPVSAAVWGHVVFRDRGQRGPGRAVTLNGIILRSWVVVHVQAI